MQDVLRDYLTETATPELRETLEEAHKVFDRIELPNYEQEFEAILMVDDQQDQGGTLQNIVEKTRQYLFELLRMHEVTVDGETSMHVLTTILNGLLDLPNYDNHDEIVRTCSMDINPQEALAELLSLVTPLSVEELIMPLEEVNFVLINRLKELAQEQNLPPASEEEQATIRAYSEKLQLLMNRAQTANIKLAIVDHIKAGLDVGYPFLTYMGLFGREIEELPDERAAYELMAMALISNDGTNNAHGIIQQYLEHYVSDPNKITRIDIKLREITLGMQR